MPGITEKELLQFLKAIEEGTISLRPESSPQDIYAGNVTYTATNGWRITIFNDCNEWDYVDKAITADGRSVNFDSIDNDMPIAREYLPADEIAWQRYGIPGYCPLSVHPLWRRACRFQSAKDALSMRALQGAIVTQGMLPACSTSKERGANYCSALIRNAAPQSGPVEKP